MVEELACYCKIWSDRRPLKRSERVYFPARASLGGRFAGLGPGSATAFEIRSGILNRGPILLNRGRIKLCLRFSALSVEP